VQTYKMYFSAFIFMMVSKYWIMIISLPKNTHSEKIHAVPISIN